MRFCFVFPFFFLSFGIVFAFRITGFGFCIFVSFVVGYEFLAVPVVSVATAIPFIIELNGFSELALALLLNAADELNTPRHTRIYTHTHTNKYVSIYNN